MSRSKQNSLTDIFFNFVNDNPKIAASLAFELGLLAGSAAKRIPWKRLKGISPDFVNAMPRSLSQSALKFLPSPELQPKASRTKKTRKRPPRRKAENTNGKKS
jgi:hypothetical protein